MKPTVKIGSLLLAVLMVFSVFASGCTLSKEWSYKTSDETLAIGIYLTAMYDAYQEAQSYASKLDDYDDSNSDWLDLEITDSEGNKAVARDWIKDEAERRTLELLVIRPELEKLGATQDEAEVKQLKSTYETQWYNSMKAVLEKLGVSMESYRDYKTDYSRLRSQLFDLLYGKGGSQEVSADEITKYLTDNYGRYSAVPVYLHESTTDEAGNSSDVALSDAKIKEITDALDGIAKQVNAIKDPKKAAETSDQLIKKYLADNGMEESQLQTLSMDRINPNTANEDLDKAIAGLEEGKAVTVKIGKEDNEKSYFYIFRYDQDSLKENYQTDGITDETLLKKLKEKDYRAYLKSLIDASGYEKSDYVDKYDPEIFFEKPEEATGATS